ncbi:MAG: glycerol-3-phosphate 1-O-acyltransferase PlsY [Pseudomonadota bacterium]
MPYNLIYLPILAYLLGSIPFGVLLTRYCSDVNVRDKGSRNIGATNVARLAGIKLGVLTLAGDALKGAIPVCLALSSADQYGGWEKEAYVSLVALSAFFGHLFSIFLHFEGGKGVATAAGCMAVLAPIPLIISLIGFIGAVYRWRYVSAGSLTAAVLLPLSIWLFMDSTFYLILALIISAFIFYAFRGNIRRLLTGTELPFRS